MKFDEIYFGDYGFYLKGGMKNLFYNMTKTFLFTLVLLICGSSFAEAGRHYSDIILLNNEMVFKGQVLKVKSCEVIFKTENKRYTIPLTDIQRIDFFNESGKAHKAFKQFDLARNSCAKGIEDAQLFHGRRFRHFMLGVVLGPIGIAGAIVSKPTPTRRSFLQSNNQDLFSDPDYLECYRKKAKNRNIKNASIGTGVTLVLMGTIALLVTNPVDSN